MDTQEMPTALIQEPRVATFKDGVKTIVGVDVRITQEDTHYDAREGRGAATHDLMVYADTLHVAQDIVLPGRNLGLFARRILIDEGVTLDTSGPAAASDHPPGSLPVQRNKGVKGNRQGHDGSGGEEGGGGGGAGDVTMVARTLEVRGSGAALPSGYPPRVAESALAGELVDLFQPLLQDALCIQRERFDFRYRRPSPASGADFDLRIRTLNLMPSEKLTRREVEWSLDYDPANLGFKVGLRFKRGFTVSFSVRRDDLPNEQRYAFYNYQQGYAYYTVPLEISATLAFGFDPESGEVRLKNTSCEVEALTPVANNGMPLSSHHLPQEIAYMAPLRLADILGGFIGDSLCAALRGKEAACQARLMPLFRTPFEPARRLDGVDASSGDAGAFRIVACGGSGGRGQDGHPGERGDRGDRGESGIIVSNLPDKEWFPPKAQGGKGFRGGRGGDAGRSGVGGAGGRISILAERVDAISLSWGVRGGLGGGRGRAGEPGPGGIGGFGAEWKISSPSASSPTGGWVPPSYRSKTAPEGAVGEAGPPARHRGELGAAGGDGGATFNGVVIDRPSSASPPAPELASMAAAMKLEQLLLIQRHARNRYLSATGAEDMEEVAAIYHWLLDMTAPFVDGEVAGEAGGEADAGGVAEEARRARAAIHGNALVETARLRRGVDYFGNPLNWAPMFRLEYLSDRAQELITNGRIIEQEYAALMDREEILLRQVESLQARLRTFDTSLDRLRTGEAALRDAIEATGSEIDRLADAIGIQTETVFQNQHKLRQVVIDAQCDLKTIMQVMSAVVSVASAALGTLDLISTGRELFKDYKDATGGLKEFLKENKKTIKEMRKTYDATIKDFKSIYSEMSDLFSPTQPPDAVKILVDRGEFRDMIKPYLEAFGDDAFELKSAVESFFDLVDARNLKLLDYNALLLELAKRRVEGEQMEAEARLTQRLMNEADGQRAPEPLRIYLRSAYLRVKDHLIAKLYEMDRAYRMFTVSRSNPVLSGYNIATIADIYESQRMLQEEYLKAAARLPSKINKSIEISARTHPAAFQALAQTGRLQFRLDPGHPEFRHYTNVKIEEIAVELPDVAVTEDSLYLAIALGGEHVYHATDERGHLESFTPPSRTVTYEYNYKEQRVDARADIFRQAGHYCRLSPFCNWSIDFRVGEDSNRFLDLEALRAVRLTLSGTAFGVS